MAGSDPQEGADLAAELEEARRRIAALEAGSTDPTLRRLTDSMLDGFSLLTPDGVHLDVNPALCEMTGFSRDELVGSGPPHAYWPEEEYGAIEATFARTLDGDTATFPLTFMRKSGERFPVLVTPAVLRDETGAMVSAYATIKDISELRRAEAALAESEHLFRLTFDQAPIGAALVSPSFRFQRVNARFARMTGFSTDELLERGFADITHPDDLVRDVAEVKRLAAGEIEEYAREKRYVRKDGSIAWGDVVVRPLRDGGDTIMAFVALVNDISERRLAEQALQRERERAGTYIDLAGVMLVAIGADQRVLLANRKACEVLRRSEAELVGADWFDATLPEAEREPIRAGFTQLMADNIAPWEYVENRVVTSSGDERLIAWHNTVLRDDDGTIVATLSSGEDVTARKQTERLLSAPAEILAILAAPTPLKETVDEIVAALKRATEFDAVGLRLQEGEDYPFLGAVGYSDEFLRAENSLAVRYADGGLCRNADGSVSLECTCGLIVSGKTDPANPLFTRGGSAWTNDSLPFLDAPAEDDPRLNPRNRCIHVGFRSLALVPLRAGDEVLGLLHLADRRTDRFTAESVSFFEGLGASIGVALSRKRAEQALRESQEQLREAHRLAHIGAWKWHAGTDTVTWTDELFRIAGRDPAGRAPTFAEHADFIAPESLARLQAAVERSLEAGEPYELELELARPDGTVRWVRSIGAAVRDDKGRVQELRGTFQDITGDKRAADEIVRLNAELQERVVSRTEQLDAATRELEALAYSMAHDVRAPLRAIDGFSALVMDDEGDRLTPDGLENLRRMRAASQTLGRLMDELVGLSKLSHRELVRSAVDVTALVTEVGAETAAENPSRQVDLTVAPGLGADADPRLLRLIYRELLGNAWKFTAPHGSAHVEVGAQDTGGERAFFVRDDGVGFDTAYAKHLFGVFQRMHLPGQFEGDGVGLATVQRLVRRHGGLCWAEAEVGKGAAFFFTLPPAPQ